MDFRVDDFLKSSSLVPCDVYRKVDPKGLRGRLNKKSGLTVVVSDADGDDLKQQIEDAVQFIERHQEEVERLRDFAGVEGVSLDFGVRQRGEFVGYYSFPTTLLRLAGNLGLAVELSVYVAKEN